MMCLDSLGIYEILRIQITHIGNRRHPDVISNCMKLMMMMTHYAIKLN